MAADYWASTQHNYWLFTKDTLYDIRDEIEAENAKVIKSYPLPDSRLMLIYFKDRLHQLAKRLQFRQQCVATALVYIQRYLLSTPVQTVNLYLLCATAFYLASKTEESPHHIRLVAAEARTAWPEYIGGDVSRLGEMEFSLISEMRSQLTVWHPYRTLLLLKDDPAVKITPDEYSLAWAVINDSYMTDLPLTCPPHIIAVVALFLAVLFVPNRQTQGTQPLLQSLGSGGDAFSSVGRYANLRGAMSGGLEPPSAGQHSRFLSSHSANGSNRFSDSGEIHSNEQHSASQRMQKALQFFSGKELDLEQVIEATQEMISLYEIWEQYNEKAIKDAVERCHRGRSLDT